MEQFKYAEDSLVSEPNADGDREVKVFIPAELYDQLGSAAARAGRPLFSFLTYAVLDAVIQERKELWNLRRRVHDLYDELKKLGRSRQHWAQ
jgi:hypothetical protein